MAIADSFLEFRGLQENMKPAVGTSLDRPAQAQQNKLSLANQLVRSSRTLMRRRPGLAWHSRPRIVRQSLEKRRAAMLTGWAGKS